MKANARLAVAADYTLIPSDLALKKARENRRSPNTEMDDNQLRLDLIMSRVEKLIGTPQQASTLFIMEQSVRGNC